MTDPRRAGPGLLAEVRRGALVESEHRGHLVVLRPDGTTLLAVGDPGATIWPRSAVKPLQAVAMLRSGLEIDDEGLALACASHSGTAAHVAVVRRVLDGAGLGEQDLQNTPDLPLDPEAADERRRGGHGPSSVTQNCSGKHAAMLATCVAAGWELATYRAPEHPLQRAVRDVVAELTGTPVEHVTVDGCGAPLLSSTTEGLARAFGRLASAPTRDPGSAEARVARVMSSHPWLVGGPGRDVTALMAAVPGMVAKDGAEGVHAVGLADGSAVALKIADGAGRPRAAVTVAALETLWQQDWSTAPGADALARVRAVGQVPVLGHGRPVGQVVAVLHGSTDQEEAR